MDLIKRSDAIKVIEETLFIRRPILPHYLIAKIKDIPSAEKQGEWIWNQYDGNPAIGNYHCSICRRLVPHDKYAFCPNCGCRMRGAGDDAD